MLEEESVSCHIATSHWLDRFLNAPNREQMKSRRKRWLD